MVVFSRPVWITEAAAFLKAPYHPAEEAEAVRVQTWPPHIACL